MQSLSEYLEETTEQVHQLSNLELEDKVRERTHEWANVNGWVGGCNASVGAAQPMRSSKALATAATFTGEIHADTIACW